MLKKRISALLIGTLVFSGAILVVPTNVNAKVSNSPSLVMNNQEKKMVVKEGTVLQVNLVMDEKGNAGGKLLGSILMSDEYVSADAKLRLNIGKNTEIVNTSGKKIKLKDLKKGTRVVAVHGVAMTASMPPQVSATKIYVVEGNNTVTGKIFQNNEIDGRTSILIGENFATHDFCKMSLNITKDTEIVDMNGKKLTKDALTEGTQIIGIHEDATTRSLPPQSNAKKIIVLKQCEELNNLEAAVVGVKDNYVTLVGSGKYARVILNITDKTEIVDEKGNKLTKDDIKEGGVVEATFGNLMTKSMPPIVNAEKVVVKFKGSVSGKILDINKESKYKSILVGDAKTPEGAKMRLIIGEDTKIVDLEGKTVKFEDLKEDCIVVAIHSPAVALSLPPQSVAEKIIVLNC